MRAIDADALEASLENSCDTEVATYYFVEFLNYVDDQPTLDVIIFPQTIGDITYNSKDELIKWIEKQQRNNSNTNDYHIGK